MFNTYTTSCFSTFMAEKKATKKTTKKAETKTKKATTKKTAKKTTTKAKTTKSKTTKSKAKSKKKTTKIPPMGDMGIVIVDDDIEIDQEKVNEERRAYLEEARSQEAFD